MNNCQGIVITYLANSEFFLKSTRQVVAKVTGDSSPRSNERAYQSVFKTLLKLEREGVICSLTPSPLVGRFWYHPDRINQPLSGQKDAN